MLKINHSDVKRDMLSISSNVREVLRALYFYGPDYIVMKMGGRERLVHKEQLVSLLELGKSSSTIEDIMKASLNEPISARMQLEDIPQNTLLLVFVQKGNGKAGDLSRMTFEEYRENAIKESVLSFPDWWGIPLPLLFIDKERVVFNEQGVRLMPCDAAVLAKQATKILRDKMITIREKKLEKTFSLRPLGENIYLIEDISGDFEMAEDLIWWAAAGKAFYRRLEENGAVIRRLSPFEEASPNFAEIIPCSWEGELIGSIAIGLPGEADFDEPSEDNSEEPDESQIETAAPDTPDAVISVPEEEIPAPKPAKRKRAKRKTTAETRAKPKAASEEKSAKTKISELKPEVETIETTEKSAPETGENVGMFDIEESFEAPSNLTRLNKHAAHKAYGGMAVRKAAPENEQKSKG